ncbi:MAG: SH3 domain-containing protein [Devosia sp.]
MALPLFTEFSRNLLVRTAVVSAAVFILLGAATGVLPVRCLAQGSLFCDPPAKPGATTTPKTATTSATVLETVAIASPETIAPTLTRNDVIAATFAQLKIDLKLPSAPETSPVRVATAPVPTKSVTDPDTGLTKRVVRAITVHADGTPDLSATVAESYAAPRPLISTPSPAVEAAARIGAGQTPIVAEASPAELSPAPAVTALIASGMAIVAGKGANVRSNPSKTGGKVLFALRGGEQVSVVESKRGWVRIKDDQGRSGWIYGDGLTRG